MSITCFISHLASHYRSYPCTITQNPLYRSFHSLLSPIIFSRRIKFYKLVIDMNFNITSEHLHFLHIAHTYFRPACCWCSFLPSVLVPLLFFLSNPTAQVTNQSFMNTTKTRSGHSSAVFRKHLLAFSICTIS